MTQILNLLLVFVLDFKHAGLALSISLAAVLNCSLLLWKLRQHKIYQPRPGWVRFTLQVVLSVSVMSLVLWGITTVDHDWHDGNMGTRLLHLLPLVLAGMAAYFASLTATGLRLKHFMRREGH